MFKALGLLLSASVSSSVTEVVLIEPDNVKNVEQCLVHSKCRMNVNSLLLCILLFFYKLKIYKVYIYSYFSP